MENQNKQILKRAVIYCRVSTVEQAEEGNSLVTQERACREYATKNGFEVIESYIERGESAKTADRTQLQKMLAYATQKKSQISAVIVYKIDRLSRNTTDYSNFRVLLKRYGVQIKSTSEQIEDTPQGRFMETIMAASGQFDNDVRAERCSNGMREAMREGRYVWGAPVGYSNHAAYNGKPTIAPNETAPLVKKSFELIATGLYSTEDVRRRMGKEGLCTPNGKPISKQYFPQMLRNKLFPGWIEKFGEIHRGKFEPIIEDQLFEQVQRVLKNKGKRVAEYKRDNEDFPLRRFVFSPDGLKLTGSWAKGKYPYYRFSVKGSNYQRDEVEKQFAALMDSYRFEEPQIKKLKRFVREQFHAATASERADASTFQTRLQALEGEQTTLVQKNIKGVVNDSVLKQQLDRIERETAEIYSQLALLRNADISPEEAVEYAEGYLLAPSKVWRKSDLSVQTRLQWFQFPSGVVFNGQIFETPKVSSVFKAKEAILSPDSSRVDLGGIEPPSVQCECTVLPLNYRP
jgi:site-specific DNA recombinase